MSARMWSRLIASFCPLVLLVVAAIPSAYAETVQQAKQGIQDRIDVYGIFEDFAWKEFDRTGLELLKESGKRGGVGFSYAVDFSNGLSLLPRLEITGGQVDYDGQTQAGTPVFSDTDYFGATFEIDLGGKLGDRFTIEPFGGLGFKTWWRDINDSFDINGNPVVGYLEAWSSIYGRLGLRAAYRISDTLNLFIEGAGLLPWYSQNRAYLTDIGYLEDPVFEPKARTAFFAEAGLRIHIFRISAFYETMRFDASDPEFAYNALTATTEVLYQPRSETDRYGVRIGASF